MKIHTFFDDFQYEDSSQLLLIKTQPIAIHKFVFNLNNHLNIKFLCKNNHLLNINHTFYSHFYYQFEYHDGENIEEIELFQNESLPNTVDSDENSLFSSIEEVNYLIPEYKKFNYLIKFNSLLFQNFSLDLQNYNLVLGIKEIPLSKVKNKNNLVVNKNI
jgi:hypothetical protein